MTQEIILIVVAIVLLLLAPIVPKLVQIRIRSLRWLKWNKIADWHERNIPRLTLIIRIVLILLAICLIGIVVI